MNTIDLQRVPFSGYSLIEASAGTGKTYTISQLVLRLVLLGQSNEQPLPVENILVVTFTKAATQELKDRIRANLVVALTQLNTWQAVGVLAEAKLNLSQLPDTLKEEQNDSLKAIILDALALHTPSQCRLYLQRAIFKMDEAPIFTIHSFCQRMLGEYALLAGKPLHQDLVEQSKPIIIQLAQKFWRDTVYHLNADQVSLVLKQFKTPRDLADSLANYLSDELIDAPSFTSLDEFKQACDDTSQLYAQVQSHWQADEAEIRAFFDVKGLGASYRSNHLAARFVELESYCVSGSGVTGLLGTLKDNKVHYFLQSVLDDKCKQPIAHPLFSLLDQLHLLQKDLRLGLVSFFRLSLQTLLVQYKNNNNICFFDDLISQFSDVLTAEQVNSKHLQTEIRRRFPVALIDEFQDTDKQQFQIFDAIYQQDKQASLMMIGDPKQAIYSFRGADIQTYFSARDRVTQNQQYTLDVNWRSLPSLVSGVNSLFSQHENTFVQAGFPPYPEVKSPDAFSAWQGLVVSDEKGVEQSAALSVFSQFDQQLKKSDGTEFVAQQTAQFLSQLLSKGSRINGQAIQPKDIAILVRKSAQAKIMQAALSAEGLNSIFLSKQTVLESDDVPAFIRLVKACVSPFDKSAVLAALGDSLIGFNLDKLEELNCDPSELFVIQDSFSEAKKIAQSKGFIVMWQWLVNRFDVATQLLSGLQGERRLTNINQLAEIVHAQVPSSDLEQQLQAFIDIYLECTQGDGDDTNSQKMRLESEANLIEIVTIHGSKGLEYPMVCCPFVSESDGLRKGFSKLFQPDKSAYEIIWEASDAQKKLLLADQLAEDVRLLYVAFTRAKYHLNISWQPFKGVEATPLWHILSTTGLSAIKESNEDEFKAFFTTLNGCVVNPVASDVTIKTDACGSDWQWQLKALTRNFYEPMVARSYSALLGSHHSGGQLPAGEEAWQSELQESLANDEGRDEVAEIIETVDVYALNMFNFPRGAHAGNFLHLLYETVNFQDSATFIPCIEKLSEHYLIHEKWQACLVEHLEQFMLKPLAPLNVCLANLSAASIKKEMGFHLIAKPTQGREVAEILSQYRGGAGLESLNDMQGLFKGFIDLIFEHQGKFYVLDYKSNHLGHHFSDYHLEQMHDAMLDHNYDLQYLVYTCALHLYLQQRIHNYAYDEHMGGIFYTFIRGVNEHDASGIYFKRPELSTIQRLSSLFENVANGVEE